MKKIKRKKWKKMVNEEEIIRLAKEDFCRITAQKIMTKWEVHNSGLEDELTDILFRILDTKKLEIPYEN
jgi:hypothetical protein